MPPSQPRARAVGQLLRRVLEAEGEQQQHDADLGCEVDEVLRQLRPDEAALAEHHAGDEVRRDRADADAVGEPREQREPEDDRAELDERDRDVL